MKMVGRPPKDNKKVREAVYFDPDLLDWLKEKAENEMCTVSVIVNRICSQAKKKDA